MASRLNGARAKEPEIAPWPAYTVERRPVADLKPYERNSRTHTPAQIVEVARSIQKWGWTMPVLIDEADGILAGHARVMAAQHLKLAEVPVVVARGWSNEAKRAYIIADNKIGLNAGWDWDLLALEIGDLRSIDGDLSALMGFTPLEVSSLLAEPTVGERHLADQDPAEDATWPTFEIKMPPRVYDQVRAKLDAVVAGEGEAAHDWHALAFLLDIEVPRG